MKKEIEWEEKAFEINKKILVEIGVDYKAFTAEQMTAFDLMSERLARGLRYEHMFKKLIRSFDKEMCPIDLVNEDIIRKMLPCPSDLNDSCPRCGTGKDGICNHEKCWRNFCKKLEEK